MSSQGVQALIDMGMYKPKFPDSPFIHIADLINKETGKTYREENSGLKHNIPVGALVEYENGIRLFVVKHTRDCDQTPLYCLGPDPDDTTENEPGFANRGWSCGYPEYSLKIVRLPD